MIHSDRMIILAINIWLLTSVNVDGDLPGDIPVLTEATTCKTVNKELENEIFALASNSELKTLF